jgi:DNA-binding CsgD family transcriptional regulator
MDRNLFRVIEMFYQASVEPTRWESTLAATADLLRGDHAFLYTTNRSDREVPLMVTTGLGEADVARYFSPDANLMWAHWHRVIPFGRPMIQSEIIADRDFQRLEFYNEIVRPTNGFYSSCFQQDLPDASFHIALCRPRMPGAFSEEDRETLGRLAPHLTTAIALRKRLRLAEQYSSRLTTIIERMEEAAIVLDAQARPLIVNARAAQILARQDGLHLAFGELRATNPALTGQLQNAIEAAGSSAAANTWQFHVPRASRLPLLLAIMPIWRLDLAEAGMRAPSAVVFIREPDAALTFSRPALIDIFGMTPRECDIACLLAEGQSVEAIANRLGLRLSTVRQNLKHTFEKTHVHSQAALVALVRGFGR